MGNLFLRFILIIILLLRLTISPVSGEESPAPEAASFPGVSEVVPRASQVSEEKLAVGNKLASLDETATVSEQIQVSRSQLTRMVPQLADQSGPLGHSFEQALDLREKLTDQKNGLEQIINLLSSDLAEIEALEKEWTRKKTFWEEWRDSLNRQEIHPPKEEFQQTFATIEDVLSSISTTSSHLVQLQKEAADIQEQAAEMLSRVQNAIRGQTFKKVSHSFASREYREQFDPRLWSQVRNGISEVQGISSDFLREQGWVAALQLLLVFTLAGFIIHHRPKAEETEEWQFILIHPWATGIFVALSTLSFFYTQTPDLWQFLLWLPAAFSAATLMCALLKNPRKRLMIWLLASLFVLSLGLRSISFPVPLYRLYLALLSLFGIPLFLYLAASNQRAHKGQLTGFTVTLRIGAAVLLIAFIAQFAGYSTLSFRLIESSIKTVFLGLFAVMTIKLGQGSIDFFLDQPFFRRWRFFRRFGSDLTTRLKDIFMGLVIILTSLYLLKVWNLYNSMAEAWSHLLALSLTIEDVNISVENVLVVVLVLYISMGVSWLIQAILEAEFFPRRRFDRGVRDSIKKLLNYSLILIGFLFAMSLAGVELKNFAVLAGAFGIGIGFGLQNVVNNFVSGLILLFERPVKVGDMVVIDNEWGTVRKIGLRSTVVTNLDESEVIVPNSLLVSQKVTNWSLTSPLCRLTIPIGVAYGSDVPLVLKILTEAGQQHSSVLGDPEPSPLFKGFGDSSLDFELRVWISEVRDRFRVRSEICQYIDRRFREDGIVIPFPQRDLHLRSVEADIFNSQENRQTGRPQVSRPAETVEDGEEKRQAQPDMQAVPNRLQKDKS